jgi:Kef-type K+ transport system membrane component KefB|tara:strand:+ start:276 stop:1559 length:1284 start_codon:yes stop_codon:yes gene_type:complete
VNTVLILFALPLLVIFSYLFDAFARKTKFPAVILLLLTGVFIRVITSANGYVNFEFLNDLIPVLGTIGLILIVLEGALELEINKQKLPIILKGFLSAIVILLLNIIVISWLFNYFIGMELHTATIFATPLSIISSAVAIPSAANLLNKDKEFVVYESTFSDILGIVIFNYVIRQAESGQPMIAIDSIVGLGLQILGIVVISVLITYILFRLLHNIENNVKFFLILSLLILVYAIGKFFHLPALLTIFIFGVFLSNIKELLPKFLLRYFQLNHSEKDLHEFHILTAESTFIVRTFFFLFFGFSIVISDFDSFMPLIYGVLVFAIMFLIRYLYFVLTSFKIKPSVLLYMSPRGLISILLFLQIKDLEIIQTENSVIDERMLLVVILTSMLVMTFGTLSNKQKSIPEKAILDEEEMIGLNSSEGLIEQDK